MGRGRAELLGVDRAVFLALVTRVWQFISGPITLLLMTNYFTGATRGYFYTFNNLLTLQVFFELGLHIVIVNIASHEWAHLRLDSNGQIEGDHLALARLVSIGRASLKWYLAAGLLFLLCCGPGGAIFFAQGSLPVEEWFAAWVLLVLITSCSLAIQPLIAVLEGCDQVAVVNQYRVRQAVIGSVVVWVMIVGGLNLWAVVGSQVVRFGFDVWLVSSRFRRFFSHFRREPTAAGVDWRVDVWPMQWRIGLQGLATWWATQLITPVIFEFHGDVEAGRMGMTWSILVTLQSSAFVWIETRRPIFGRLVAHCDYQELDRRFFRYATISFALLIVGVMSFWCGVLVVNNLESPVAVKIANALLPPLPTLLLGCGVAVFHIPNCQSVYVRAHRRDPFLLPSLLLCASIGASVTWLGRDYGVVGASAAWMAAISGFQLPVWTLLWHRFRRDWQHAHPAASLDRPVND